MFKTQPPDFKTYFINLPLSRLHILEAGEGEPLIIVPATISELENWRTLAQFMAQWFHVIFFELPGHGESEAFQDSFSSLKVAKLISQLADELEFNRFNLMGFSFGGILSMRTFKLLSHRIDRMILIAPCLGYQTLLFSSLRLNTLYKFNQFLSKPKIQKKFVNLIRNPETSLVIVKLLQKIGQLEDTLLLHKKLISFRASTISVLNAQISEILSTEFKVENDKYETPCYFAMSINDPLLCFESAHNILNSHFANVSTVQLDYPYHQPPTPFTYEELNRDFYRTVNTFIRTKTVCNSPFSSQQANVREPGKSILGSEKILQPIM